jgi:mono/diheme cytochrome c family protein
MMRAAILVIGLSLVAALATGSAPLRRQPPQADRREGREAFIASGCAECHRVSGDPGLPASAPHGPLLRGMSALSTSEISSLITARSPSGGHWLEAAESGMSKATGCTSLQDVRSIAAYLQASAR